MRLNLVEGTPVLVTGAGGFIGSHLVEHLLELGADVTALVRYDSRSSNGWLEEVCRSERLRIVRGDIRDQSFVESLAARKRLIFNLAALIGIPYSYDAPSSYFDVNLGGALNLLEHVRKVEDCTLVQLSTSEVYGSAQYVPIPETHPLQPQSPYSASKIAADAATLSYHSAFGARVILARPFNTYGPRQSFRAVIPTILSQLLSPSKEVILGNLSARRDFCFVGDTVRSLVELSCCEEAIGQAINIGTGASLSVLELVEKLSAIVGVEKPIRSEKDRLRPEKSEVDCLECDPSKLRELTGDAATTTLSTGLAETIKWYEDRTESFSADSNRYYV